MAKRGTQEWKQNIKQSRLGQPSWNKGLTLDDPRVKKYAIKLKDRVITEEWRKRISLSNKGKKPWNKGKSWNDEIKRKISKAKKGKPNYKNRGKNHYNWRNGITAINDQIRQSLRYRKWRIKVFERDKFTCQICKEVGRYLEADHIKQFAIYPKLRFNINNGRTLCKNCHK